MKLFILLCYNKTENYNFEDIENYNFENSKIDQNCNNELAIIKNRLCYQKYDEPVITI